MSCFLWGLTGLCFATALVLASLLSRARGESAKAESRAATSAAVAAREAARARDLQAAVEKSSAAYRALRNQAQGKLSAASEALLLWKSRYERLAHWEPVQSLKETHDQLRDRHSELESQATALRNTIEGYGNRYVVPPFSQLDALAREAGHTVAGQRLKAAREKTRAMARSGEGATTETGHAEFRTSAAELALDAFNGRVEAALALVKSDNIGTLTQRINDAFTIVNDLGKGYGRTRVNRNYLNARLNELKCATTVHLLKQEQREEQRQVKERMREEARVQRDFEKAQREAKKQEAELLRERRLIEQTREQAIRDERARQEARLAEELARVSEAQRTEFEAQFRARVEGELAVRTAEFEAQLSGQDAKIRELEERTQRAKSMAEQTRKGTVYVISNVGAFGEGIYKIGLTRRLDPLERIAELGDASVPFDFDVHALVPADDAPALERDLHEEFAINQVNKMNWRKEFFRVSLSDIRAAITGMDKAAEWTMEAAAREYHETLALENQFTNDPEAKARWIADQQGMDFDRESPVAADDDELDGVSSDAAS